MHKATDNATELLRELRITYNKARQATITNEISRLIDDLDAKMNGLSRFMAKDRQPGAWTEFNRLFERYFLKGDLLLAEEAAPEPPPLDNSQKTLFNP